MDKKNMFYSLYRMSSARNILGFLLKILVLIISICIVLVITVEKTISKSQGIEPIWGDEVKKGCFEMGDSNQKDTFPQILPDTNQSITQNGYTITLESAKFDGCRGLFGFRVDGPSEIAFKADRYSLLCDICYEMPNVVGNDTGIIYVDSKYLGKKGSDINSISFLVECIVQQPENSKLPYSSERSLSIKIDGIREHQDLPNRSDDIEGEWLFSVRLPHDQMRINEVECLEKPTFCPARRRLRSWNFDINVEILSFRLRTLSATVSYKMPITGLWDGIKIDPVIVVMNDGSIINAQYKMEVYRGKSVECIYLFDQPITFTDVAYIHFPYQT